MTDTAPAAKPTALPQRRGMGLTVREVMVEEASIHPRAVLRNAAIQMLAGPVLLAYLMYVAGEPLYHYIALIEIMLVAGIGAWELWSGREAARRFAVVVVFINMVLVAGFALFLGNPYIAVFQSAMTLAFMVQAYGRRPRKAARAVSWAIALLAVIAISILLIRARALMNDAADAYWRGDYVAAYGKVEEAAPFMAVRGGTKADKAVFAFRRAELAVRAGDARAAGSLVEKAEVLSRNLGVPGRADEETTLDEDDELNKFRKTDPTKADIEALQSSLGYALGSRGIIVLRADAYALRAWGEESRLPSRFLGDFKLRREDMLSPWMTPFIEEESRLGYPGLFLP